MIIGLSAGQFHNIGYYVKTLFLLINKRENFIHSWVWLPIDIKDRNNVLTIVMAIRLVFFST